MKSESSSSSSMSMSTSSSLSLQRLMKSSSSLLSSAVDAAESRLLDAGTARGKYESIRLMMSREMDTCDRSREEEDVVVLEECRGRQSDEDGVRRR